MNKLKQEQCYKTRSMMYVNMTNGLKVTDQL